jgi:hypothetical protein
MRMSLGLDAEIVIECSGRHDRFTTAARQVR